MTRLNQKQRLFEQVVTNGLYVDLCTVPSQRRGEGLCRYEVIDQTGRLLGKGATKSAALAAAWRRFQQESDK